MARGRTQEQVLRSIKTYPIAILKCSQVNSQAICSFIDALSVGRTPQTVESYLMHLSAIFRLARPKWNYPLDPQALKDARTVARDLEQTGKSRGRERRPTIEEIDRLIAYFLDSHAGRPHSMKHPGQKIGNNVWCDLPEEALRVILSMPRVGHRIFPYNHRSVSSRFTRACRVLLKDLHFHDLRHEGVSRCSKWVQPSRMWPPSQVTAVGRACDVIRSWDNGATNGRDGRAWTLWLVTVDPFAACVAASELKAPAPMALTSASSCNGLNPVLVWPYKVRADKSLMERQVGVRVICFSYGAGFEKYTDCVYLNVH